MADLMDFVMTPLGPAAMTVPRVQITGRVVDSADQSIVLGDFTGANAILFPNVLAALNQEQRLTLMRMIVGYLIDLKYPSS